MGKNAVFVSGMGCFCSAGKNVNEAAANMYKGQRNPVSPSVFKTGLDKTYPVFEANFDKDSFPDNHTRTSCLASMAVEEALKQAMLNPDSFDPERIGVCLGTTVGCTLNNEPFYRAYRAGDNPDSGAINKYLTNNPACFIAEKYGLEGPVATIANACSSGTDAVGVAKRWIEDGLCDIVIAGGADELSRITYLGFISLLIASSEPCRPFDKNRSGLNLGEGAGVLIVESAGSIRKRSAEIMAEVAGYASYSDAYHPTAPHPDGRGLKRALKTILSEGKIDIADVGMINTHGTSTPENDRVEGSVIASVFGEKVNIVSTKSYTGHTLGASGGLEAVFTVKSLIDQKIPATAGFLESDAECKISPSKTIIELDTEIGISNSLAFGGNNSSLIFRRRK